MKIEVDVRKRYFFSFLAVVVIVAGIIGVYAAITNDKPNPGHNINEVQGIECASGQAITRTTSGWGCVDLPAATTSSGGLYDYSQCNTKTYGFSTGNVVCDADSVVIGDNTERFALTGSGGKMVCCKLKEPSKIDFSDKVTKNLDCGVDRVVTEINAITVNKIDYNCAKIKSTALLANPVCRAKNKNTGVISYVADSSRENELFNGAGYCVSS